jgi:hypothetical protein
VGPRAGLDAVEKRKNFFFNSHSGGSTRHVGHWMAYCTSPGWLWWWRIWWNVDLQGKPKYSEKTCPSTPLCPPQIPLDQNRARTRAAAVGSQRLTAWAMAWPREKTYSYREPNPGRTAYSSSLYRLSNSSSFISQHMKMETHHSVILVSLDEIRTFRTETQGWKPRACYWFQASTVIIYWY